MNIMDYIREIRDYKFVRAITVRPQQGYAVVYLDIKDNSDIIVLQYLQKIARDKYGLLASLVPDKKMMIIREISQSKRE